jgi:ubiquinone/menaquinone biosynthesis C-methylase UbiE
MKAQEEIPLVVDPPKGFESPTQLPESEAQAREWQQANRSWWEQHPMRYDWRDPIPYPEFSKEFYDEIDRRFLENAREFMPWQNKPFEELMPHAQMKDWNVLEIGVGNGTHAQLLATSAKTFTGIDLTEYAVKSTTNRMKVRGITNATIKRMDAEKLEFPDNHFDFVWSWGVIHCASDTNRVLREIYRVLKPGGRAVIMVYHRSFWQYYVLTGLFYGIFKGDLFRTRSLDKTLQRRTDGALARYYTADEWKAVVEQAGHKVLDTVVHGSKAEMIPLPGGGFKNAVMGVIPNAITRFMSNNLKFGMFLTTISEKPR